MVTSATPPGIPTGVKNFPSVFVETKTQAPAEKAGPVPLGHPQQNSHSTVRAGEGLVPTLSQDGKKGAVPASEFQVIGNSGAIASRNVKDTKKPDPPPKTAVEDQAEKTTAANQEAKDARENVKKTGIEVQEMLRQMKKGGSFDQNKYDRFMKAADVANKANEKSRGADEQLSKVLERQEDLIRRATEAAKNASDQSK